jgi:hypothetical protein
MVDTYNIRITANTVYGALHGLESLVQMAELQAGGLRVIRGIPWNITGWQSTNKQRVKWLTPGPPLYRSQTPLASSTAVC